MKLTRNQLQQLVREEYVKVVLESKGYKPSARQVRVLAENLDEGFLDSIKKAIVGDPIERARKKASSAEEKAKKARAAADVAEMQPELNQINAENKTRREIVQELTKLQQSAKNKLKSNKYVAETDNDLAVRAVEIFREAIAVVMEAASITEFEPVGGRGVGTSAFSPATRMARTG